MINKYTYNILGEYKDWCEIKKNDIILHNGSLIGLIKYSHEGLKLMLNYNTQKNYVLEIKKMNDFFLALPKDPECLIKDYLYVPLIYNEDEFSRLISISYIERSLVDNINVATREDLIKMWLFTNSRHSSYIDYIEMKIEVIDSFRAFSNYDDEIYKFLEKILSGDFEINIFTLERNFELITIYEEINNKFYEWKGIVKIKNKYYLKLDEEYIVGLT